MVVAAPRDLRSRESAAKTFPALHQFPPLFQMAGTDDASVHYGPRNDLSILSASAEEINKKPCQSRPQLGAKETQPTSQLLRSGLISFSARPSECEELRSRPLGELSQELMRAPVSEPQDTAGDCCRKQPRIYHAILAQSECVGQKKKTEERGSIETTTTRLCASLG